jgi:hypothetical protein
MQNLENEISEHEKISSATQKKVFQLFRKNWNLFGNFGVFQIYDEILYFCAFVVLSLAQLGARSVQQHHPELHPEFGVNENLDFQTLRSRFSISRRRFLPLPLAGARGGRKSIEKCKITIGKWNFSRF